MWKSSGDKADVTHYKERIIDRRFREETTIGDEQFGFMPGRGTTDAIFAVCQLMEKHREKQKELHRDSSGARLCVNAAPNCQKAHSFLPRVP